MRFVQILIIPSPKDSGNYKDLDKMSVKLFPNSLVIIWLHILTKLLSSNYINHCTAPTQFVSSTLIVTLNLIDAINLRCSPLQHFFERYPFLGDFTFVFLGQVITWVNQPPNPTFGVRDENVTFKWDYKLNVGDKLDVLFFKYNNQPQPLRGCYQVKQETLARISTSI